MPKAVYVLEWQDDNTLRYDDPKSLRDEVAERWAEIKRTVEDAVEDKLGEVNGINYYYDVEFYEDDTV